MANKKFFSTKTYRQIGPVAYRQWRMNILTQYFCQTAVAKKQSVFGVAE